MAKQPKFSFDALYESAIGGGYSEDEIKPATEDGTSEGDSSVADDAEIDADTDVKDEEDLSASDIIDKLVEYLEKLKAFLPEVDDDAKDLGIGDDEDATSEDEQMAGLDAGVAEEDEEEEDEDDEDEDEDEETVSEEIDFEDLGTPLVNQKKGNPTKVTSTPEKPPGVLHNVAKGKTGDGKVLEKPELDEEEGTPLVNQKSGNPTKVTGTANVIKGVIKGGGKGDQDLFQKN